MIRNFFLFLARRLGGYDSRVIADVARDNSRLQGRLTVAQREVAAALARLETATKRLQEAEQDLAQAGALARRYEVLIEEERSKCKVHETTIATLVAANQLHLNRYDAESAIQARRQVAATTRE